MKRFGVIMAGGAGERFWPLSRKERPKQLLPLAHPVKSMLAESIERLGPVIPPQQVFVITGEHLVAPIRAANTGVPDENIIAEPYKRNTAGALAYITAVLLARNPDLQPSEISIVIATADHRIGEPKLFVRTITTALEAAEQEQALVVCGIVPNRPETGFGYIEIAEDARPIQAFREGIPVHTVSGFKEKPDNDLAQKYVTSGRYFWNSGMFFWTLGAFLHELDHARPAIAQATRDMAALFAKNDVAGAAARFEALEDISIDYALMERARKVLMVRGAFPWEDIGAWPAIEDPEATDADGNFAYGDPVLYDATNTIVYNAAGKKIAVGVAGVDNLVVVVTDDAVLVIPKDRAQDVRYLVKALKDRGATQT